MITQLFYGDKHSNNLKNIALECPFPKLSDAPELFPALYAIPRFQLEI